MKKKIVFTFIIPMVHPMGRKKKQGGKKKSRELRIEKWDQNTWAFSMDNYSYEEEDEFFEMGCDLIDEGNYDGAAILFGKMVERRPEYLDAMHHLAIALDGRGDTKDAMALWRSAVEKGRSAIPGSFRKGRDTLPWGILENRPFLRCLHGYGCTLKREGITDEAIGVFEEVLGYNPDDNQGVRELLMQLYLEKDDIKGARSVIDRYEGDMMSGLLYGHPLVLIREGKVEEAKDLLADTIAAQPRVAKELLKKKHPRPKGVDGRYLSYGGRDQAYYYWRDFGGFWREPDLKILAEVADSLGLDDIVKEIDKQDRKRERSWNHVRQEKEAPVDLAGYEEIYDLMGEKKMEDEVLAHVRNMMGYAVKLTEYKFDAYWEASVEEGAMKQDRKELAKSFYGLGAMCALIPTLGLGLDDSDFERMTDLLEKSKISK